MNGFSRGGYINSVYYTPGLYELRNDGTPFDPRLDNPTKSPASHFPSVPLRVPPMYSMLCPPPPPQGSWFVSDEELMKWRADVIEAKEEIERIIEGLRGEEGRYVVVHAKAVKGILVGLKGAIERPERR